MSRTARFRLRPARPDASQLLRAAAAIWFSVALLGMWIFVFYVTAYYGNLLLDGGLQSLEKTHLPNGYIQGDVLGNLAISGHLMLAICVIGLGPLQLIPWIRRRFPHFHRRNGRIYLLTAFLSAVAGLYMVWTRGTIGGEILRYAITLDGLLIIAFGTMTLQLARARNLYRHRRWALRFFVVTSAVWFYRVGLMAWVMLTGGAGVDFATFSGPFLMFWGFAQYLLPLAVLELYLFAKDAGTDTLKIVTTGVIGAATIVMAIGIFAATMGMWLPRIA